MSVLKNCLKAPANQILWDKGPSAIWTFDALLSELKQRFGVDAVRAKFVQELYAKRRKPGESIQQVEADIRSKLCRALGAETESKAGEMMGLNAFIEALNDPSLAERIRDRDPKTITEAVSLAVRFEVSTSLAKAKPASGERKASAIKLLTPGVDDSGEEAPENSTKIADRGRNTGKKQRQVASIEAKTAASAPSPSVEELLQQVNAMLQHQRSQQQPTKQQKASGRKRGGGAGQATSGRQQHQQPEWRPPPSCFRCGLQGHFARNCDLPPHQPTQPTVPVRHQPSQYTAPPPSGQYFQQRQHPL